MKKLIYVFVLLAFSCNEKKKELTREEKASNATNYAVEHLKDSKESISLLAIANDIPARQLQSMLTDYYARWQLMENDEPETYENLVKGISIKYNMSAKRVATLVYNYEYEILTSPVEIEKKADREMDESGNE
mgnify:CR=1 FL=1